MLNTVQRKVNFVQAEFSRRLDVIILLYRMNNIWIWFPAGLNGAFQWWLSSSQKRCQTSNVKWAISGWVVRLAMWSEQSVIHLFGIHDAIWRYKSNPISKVGGLYAKRIICGKTRCKQQAPIDRTRDDFQTTPKIILETLLEIITEMTSLL